MKEIFNINLANKIFMQKCFYKGEISLGLLELSKEESHHLCNVARAKAGEQVAILNGTGTVAIGKLLNCDPKHATISIDKTEEMPQKPVKISLLQAVLTNNNNDYIVREATAIGASQIFFFESQNSECKLKNKISEKIKRWHAIAIEACKQSGAPFLPKISYCERLEKIDLAQFETKLFGGLSASSRPMKEVISQHSNSRNICIAIGPEGDFSNSEYDYLRENNFSECAFSSNILRAETAAIYSLSIIEHLTQ